MPSDGDTKKKFDREYTGYEPRIELGPLTWILDTIVLPVAKEEDGSTRSVSR